MKQLIWLVCSKDDKGKFSLEFLCSGRHRILKRTDITRKEWNPILPIVSKETLNIATETKGVSNNQFYWLASINYMKWYILDLIKFLYISGQGICPMFYSLLIYFYEQW